MGRAPILSGSLVSMPLWNIGGPTLVTGTLLMEVLVFASTWHTVVDVWQVLAKGGKVLGATPLAVTKVVGATAMGNAETLESDDWVVVFCLMAGVTDSVLTSCLIVVAVIKPGALVMAAIVTGAGGLGNDTTI